MLKQRVLTAMVLVAVLLAAIFWLPPRYFDGLLTLIVAAAAWEWTSLSGVTHAPLKKFYVVIVLAVGLALLSAGGRVHQPLWIAGLVGWLLACYTLFRYPPAPQFLQRQWFLLLTGLWVLLPCWLGFHYLQRLPQREFLILWFIALVAAADIGAYFSGRAFGKYKLAPAVSPNKTIEGFVGGIVATTAVAIAGYLALSPQFPGMLALVSVACLAAVLAALSVVGDLFESLLKRQQQLKDSGTLLPGHGGVMDRLDSITAALPLYVLLLQGSGLV